MDCVNSPEAQQIPSVAQPSPARRVHSSECEIGKNGKVNLPGLRNRNCEARLGAEQIPRVAQLSQVINCDTWRIVKILGKNEEYTTKSVPSPSRNIMIVKKVKAEIGISLEKEENFENLKKTLHSTG